MLKARAIELYTKAANSGHSSALFNLAHCFEDGEGIEQDIDAAIVLYKRSAAAGEPLAMVQLGNIYMKDSDEQNISKAKEYFEAAAEHDEPTACYQLASLYSIQPNFEHNLRMALKWAEKAHTLAATSETSLKLIGKESLSLMTCLRSLVPAQINIVHFLLGLHPRAGQNSVFLEWQVPRYVLEQIAQVAWNFCCEEADKLYKEDLMSSSSESQ